MGTTISLLKQAWPPKSKFSVADVPDLSGKVMIVTGGNSGVGKETVKVLLQRNAKVYLAARSPASAKAAIDDLKAQTGKEAEFLEFDLADLHSVKRAAETFISKENQLHVLFNNGYGEPPIEQLTAQKYDLTFGTNVLGPFYFTKLLIPTLLATAASGKPVRVINTSSCAAEMISDIDYNTLKDTPARKKMTPTRLYWQSKFGNVAFSNELWRRYGDQGIVSVSLHPGNLISGLQRHLTGFTRWAVECICYPTPFGALTTLWAGTTDIGATLGGQHLIPWARVGANPSKNPAPEKALWMWLEEQVENI
ncbi:NAD(P)-binding protein [Mycena polygramma]|nr:NAD(P)-binding protein [Mycena polygramma]